jgi:FKBP-type peptidyl-prolyl cis-trans isomerase SlyD
MDITSKKTAKQLLKFAHTPYSGVKSTVLANQIQTPGVNEGVIMSELSKIQDGLVVSMDYTLLVDGEVLDTSTGHGPLEFLQGAGNIIPGLEQELYGMAVGESKMVIVQPEDGYGILDADALVDVPREQFPSDIPMEVGVEITVTDESGNPMNARIDSVNDDNIILDFNHPLAGKELHFEIKIVALREATDEENEHGHAHDGGHHH